MKFQKKKLSIILKIKDDVAIHIATLKGGIYLATFLFPFDGKQAIYSNYENEITWSDEQGASHTNSYIEETGDHNHQINWSKNGGESNIGSVSMDATVDVTPSVAVGNPIDDEGKSLNYTSNPWIYDKGQQQYADKTETDAWPQSDVDITQPKNLRVNFIIKT